MEGLPTIGSLTSPSGESVSARVWEPLAWRKRAEREHSHNNEHGIFAHNNSKSRLVGTPYEPGIVLIPLPVLSPVILTSALTEILLCPFYKLAK